MPLTSDELLARAMQVERTDCRGEAREAYAELLRRWPDHPVALQRSAWLSDAAGDVDQAVELLRRLILVRPDDARAHQDLALCLLRLGRQDEAIALLRTTVLLDPAYAPGHCNLGLALEERGDLREAAAHLRQALQLQPDSPFIAYHLAAVAAQTGESCDALSACPKDYLIRLFDDYAGRFDRHLFGTLRYRGPQLLASAVAAARAWWPRPPWDVLDLGCGTGMTGVPFRQAARQIVGVDLSPKMLAWAARRVTQAGRRVYDALIESDLVPVLRRCRGRFDVVLSADVFIYLGDLRDVFAAAREALRPGGLFAFTVETWAGPGDYRLLPTRRFAQSVRYIARLAAEVRFDQLTFREAWLRHGDDGQPVPGAVFLLRNPVEPS